MSNMLRYSQIKINSNSTGEGFAKKKAINKTIITGVNSCLGNFNK